MKEVRVSTGIVTLAQFKARAAAKLRDRLFLQSRARSWRDRLMGHTQEPKPKPPTR